MLEIPPEQAHRSTAEFAMAQLDKPGVQPHIVARDLAKAIPEWPRVCTGPEDQAGIEGFLVGYTHTAEADESLARHYKIFSPAGLRYLSYHETADEPMSDTTVGFVDPSVHRGPDVAQWNQEAPSLIRVLAYGAGDDELLATEINEAQYWAHEEPPTYLNVLTNLAEAQLRAWEETVPADRVKVVLFRWLSSKQRMQELFEAVPPPHIERAIAEDEVVTAKEQLIAVLRAELIEPKRKIHYTNGTNESVTFQVTGLEPNFFFAHDGYGYTAKRGSKNYGNRALLFEEPVLYAEGANIGLSELPPDWDFLDTAHQYQLIPSTTEEPIP